MLTVLVPLLVGWLALALLWFTLLRRPVFRMLQTDQYRARQVVLAIVATLSVVAIVGLLAGIIAATV